MPRFSFSLLLAGALLVPAPSVQAAPRFSISDAWMQEKITPPMQALPVDEALLALSKAASANVLADATHFEAGRIVQPYPAQRTSLFDSGFGRRNGVIGRQAAQAGLSYDRTAPDTLVFWQRPDRDHLVSLIVAYQKQLDEQFPRGDEQSTLTGLQEFLKTRYNWNPQPRTAEEAAKSAQGVDASLRLSDFPEALRVPIQAELISRVRSIGDAPSYRWFEDDYWNGARLGLDVGERSIFDTAGNYKGSLKGSVVKLVLPDAGARPIYIGFPQELVQRIVPPKPAPARSPKRVQGGALPSLPPTQEASPIPAQGVDVQGEGSLQKPVVFSVKQQPLAQFVAELGKKGGVGLSVAPDVAPNAKVTGCSVPAGMALSSAMGALSRLYSAHWTKDGDGYALSSDHPTELNRTMAQMGFKAFYGSTTLSPAEHDQLGTERANEIVEAIDVTQLQKPPGAPFSSLPADTQSSVLQLVRQEGQGALIAAQQRLSEALGEDITFRFGSVPADTPLFYGANQTEESGPSFLALGYSGLAAYSSKGAFIVQLFPRFTISPPSQREIELEKAAREFEKRTRNQEGNDDQ